MKKFLCLGLLCLSQFSFVSSSVYKLPEGQNVRYFGPSVLTLLQNSKHSEDYKLQQFMLQDSFDSNKSYVSMCAPSDQGTSVIGKFTSASYNKDAKNISFRGGEHTSPTEYINSWNAVRPAVKTAIEKKFIPDPTLSFVWFHAAVQTFSESKNLLRLYSDYCTKHQSFTQSNSTIEVNNSNMRKDPQTITQNDANNYTAIRNDGDIVCHQAYPTWHNWALAKCGIDGKRLSWGAGLATAGAGVAAVAPRIENQNVAAPLIGLGLAATIFGLCKIASIRNTKDSQFDVPVDSSSERSSDSIQ